MTTGKLASERSGRDADRLTRIAKRERFAVRHAFTKEVGAA